VRLTSRALYGLLIACTPAEVVDAGLDAGLDAPDTADAAGPDTPDTPDAPVALEYILEHGPAWDQPCEPWGIEPFTAPRELPADTSIRQLWHWDPTAEPDLREFNARVHAPAIGQNTFGVENQRLARIDRDGVVVWTLSFPEQIASTPAVLPDGDVIIVLTSPAALSDPSLPRSVIRVSSAGSVESTLPIPGGWSTSRVAVGPQGRVYVTTGPVIYATCRLERVVWTLRASVPDVVFSGFVEVDETLWVSGGYLYFIESMRISPAGAILEHPWPLPEERSALNSEWFTRMAQRTTAWVWTTRDGSGHGYLRLPDGAWWPIPNDADPSSMYLVLDPAGGMWTYSRAGTISRYLDRALLHSHTRLRSEPAGCEQIQPVYQDGSLLCVNSGYGVARLSAVDGAELWRLNPMADGLVLGANAVALDRTGRVYAVNSMGLFAFQTDALPPAEEDGCAIPGLGCNERHDGAAVHWTR
jgi:hypothetical protein